MSGINLISGNAAVLDQANIDTDQIIPKQFLTGVTRTGYGVNLFHDWRYLAVDNKDDSGAGKGKQPDPDFPLNNPKYNGANILLTRENFGCGSSREHAPWALADYGFDAIIATSFADIFYGNSINNQLLPITLNNQQIDQLMAAVEADATVTLSIDLSEQTVSCNELVFSFTIAPHHKNNMLKGLDAIGQTLELDPQIKKFEEQRQNWL
jgi:3-isopropylmalate/(R)-2-methylmalate dehydratase small subunit